jgi:hypothetical protein
LYSLNGLFVSHSGRRKVFFGTKHSSLFYALRVKECVDSREALPFEEVKDKSHDETKFETKQFFPAGQRHRGMRAVGPGQRSLRADGGIGRSG